MALAGILLAALMTLVACDHTRVGGTYHVFVGNGRGGSANAFRSADEYFQRSIRAWFEQHDFHEQDVAMRNASLWKKSGSGVTVQKAADDGWIVRFRAMGYNRDLNLSLRTERELMRYLDTQTGVRIIYAFEHQIEVIVVGDQSKARLAIRNWFLEQSFKEVTTTTNLVVWGDRENYGVAAVHDQAPDRVVVSFGQMGFDEGWISEHAAHGLANRLAESQAFTVELLHSANDSSNN